MGIDPTEGSLHVGHLVPLMCLFWLYVKGCHAISLVSTFNHTSLQNLIQSVDWRQHGEVWRSNRPTGHTRNDVPSGQKGEYD